MAKKWIMVRLDSETYQALNEYRGSVIRAYERGAAGPGGEVGPEGMSLSGAIRRLLRHLANDRRRMREAVVRRRERARVYRPSEE